MPHLVIVHSADDMSFHPCNDLDSAVAAIERLRNEDGVESCELFEMNPISFEFRPYYHVAIGDHSAQPGAETHLAPVVDAFPSAPSVPVMPETSLDSESLDTPMSLEAALANVTPPDPSAVVPPLPPLPATDLSSTISPPAAVADAPFVPAPAPFEPAPYEAAPADATPFDVPPAPPASDVFADQLAASEAAAVATGAVAPTEGLGFELGESSGFGFDTNQAGDSAAGTVTDMFESSTEQLPPPPPPPPSPAIAPSVAETVAEVASEEPPRRGLFGR